jgi:hypothetical protein
VADVARLFGPLASDVLFAGQGHVAGASGGEHDRGLCNKGVPMKSAYRILAYLIALEVVVQAAAIAFATFGVLAYVDGGGVLDKASEGEHAFTGAVGFMVHSVNGERVIPILAVVLLFVAYFARVPGAVLWSAVVFLTTLVQVVLGVAAGAVPTLGWVHGALAIVLFVVAVIAARKAEVPAAVEAGPG